MLRTMFTASAAETVMIAVGSNVGNRANTIDAALRAMESDSCKVQQTSFLYESSPMYVTEQAAFLNGAVQLSTRLPPRQLLHKLKDIERNLGRSAGGVRYGPRAIDLDIICYGDERRVRDGDTLTIPHPRVHEREFVLQPLCDICEHTRIPLEHETKTAKQLLQQLLAGGKSELTKVTPTHSGRLLRWGERTLLMGVINATPDSFSDGGQHNSIDSALRQVQKFCEQGFDIVDVGGQSTRPGAQLVGGSEEMRRIAPIIGAIHERFPDMLISCDTFVSDVGEHALDAGAQLINDISGGTLDGTLHSTLARRRAACVQMHTRGTPATMRSLQQYGDDVTAEVARELSRRIDGALRSGVRRWSVIADCGIGFAKAAPHSVQLMRQTRRFQALVGGYPTLLGASRKAWLCAAADGGGGGAAATAAATTTAARDWATAGAVGAAVGRGGVDAVRVHEAAVASAVRAADVIGRGG